MSSTPQPDLPPMASTDPGTAPSATPGVMARIDQRLGDWIKGWNPYEPDKLNRQGLQPVQVEESRIRRNAAKWFLGFFAVFLAWAIFAPIDAGVTVQGNVSVLGNRKAVQHPSGGVVQSIRVREGSRVKEGDLLLRINPLKSDAELAGVELQYINLLATESRLRAEQNQFAPIVWADDLERRFKTGQAAVAPISVGGHVDGVFMKTPRLNPLRIFFVY